MTESMRDLALQQLDAQPRTADSVTAADVQLTPVASAMALVAYPTCGTVEALVAARSDPVSQVRGAAGYALETLGSPDRWQTCPENPTPDP